MADREWALADQESVLKRVRPYLWAVAGKYGKFTLREELFQEAWIAAWRSLEKYDPAKEPDLFKHVRLHGEWRIKRHITLGNVFGRPSNSGKKRVVEHPVEDIVLHDRPLDTQPDSLVAHHKEIWAAINEEPEHIRRMIFEMFWLDLPKFKRSGGSWYGPYGAKSRLAKKLDHLKDCI